LVEPDANSLATYLSYFEQRENEKLTRAHHSFTSMSGPGLLGGPPKITLPFTIHTKTISGKRAPSGELENINVRMIQTKRDTSSEGNGTGPLVDVASMDTSVPKGNSSTFGDSKEMKNYAIEIIVYDKGEGNYGMI
jgi:hypothetical protein